MATSGARTFTVSCLNIRVHTQHAANEYIALWSMLVKQRYPIVSRSGNAVMIGDAIRTPNGPTDGFAGHLYRFIQINRDDPWFDIAQHKKADEDDIAKIFIPANLRANLHQIPYYFDAGKHRLYVMTKHGDEVIGIATVYKLIANMCAGLHIEERFGRVSVSIISETAAVDEILTWPVIKKLSITIERPNPTDFDDEEDVYRYLEQLNAGRIEQTIDKAQNADSITPDHDTKLLAHVAASNGRIYAEGIDASQTKRKVDSEKLPWQGKFRFNPNLTTATDFFLEKVRDLFAKVL